MIADNVETQVDSTGKYELGSLAGVFNAVQLVCLLCVLDQKYDSYQNLSLDIHKE